MERKKHFLKIANGILILFHLVGIIGFHWEESRPLFQRLVPLNLLLSLGLLIPFHKEWNVPFGLFCGLIFLAGWGVEVLGVQGGWLFGPYSYGQALGFKLAEVPIIMGINWLLLIYLTGVISQSFSSNPLVNSALGAGLLVLMDFFIEPVAIQEDFWQWHMEHVPLRNYLAWYAIGFLMLRYFHGIGQTQNNPLALPLYLIMLAFFGAFGILRVANF